MNNFNETEQQIIDVLKNVEEWLVNEKRAPTTEEIIEAVGDLGQEKYDVYAGKCKHKLILNGFMI